MRKVDKDLFGAVPLRNQRFRNTRPTDKQFEQEQRKRLEAIAARIQMDEELLKSREIKPYAEYSAADFDELKET